MHRPSTRCERPYRSRPAARLGRPCASCAQLVDKSVHILLAIADAPGIPRRLCLPGATVGPSAAVCESMYGHHACGPLRARHPQVRTTRTADGKGRFRERRKRFTVESYYNNPERVGEPSWPPPRSGLLLQSLSGGGPTATPAGTSAMVASGDLRPRTQSATPSFPRAPLPRTQVTPARPPRPRSAANTPVHWEEGPVATVSPRCPRPIP